MIKKIMPYVIMTFSIVLVVCSNVVDEQKTEINKADLLGNWYIAIGYDNADTIICYSTEIDKDYFNAWFYRFTEDSIIWMKGPIFNADHDTQDNSPDINVDIEEYWLYSNLLIFPSYDSVLITSDSFSIDTSYDTMRVELHGDSLLLTDMDFSRGMLLTRYAGELPLEVWSTDVAIDTFENDDSITTAHPISSGDVVVGHTIHLKDVDYYKTNLDSGLHYQVATSGQPMFGFMIWVTDSTGWWGISDSLGFKEPVAAYDISNYATFSPEYCSLLQFTAPYSGEYYIQISGLVIHFYYQGYYNLHIKQIPEIDSTFISNKWGTGETLFM